MPKQHIKVAANDEILSKNGNTYYKITTTPDNATYSVWEAPIAMQLNIGEQYDVEVVQKGNYKNITKVYDSKSHPAPKPIARPIIPELNSHGNVDPQVERIMRGNALNAAAAACAGAPESTLQYAEQYLKWLKGEHLGNVAEDLSDIPF